MQETCISKLPRFQPIDRTQIFLRTTDVESLIAEDHPVRAIWIFLGRLDLSKFSEEQRAVEGASGDLRFPRTYYCRFGSILMRAVFRARGRSAGRWSMSRAFNGCRYGGSESPHAE